MLFGRLFVSSVFGGLLDLRAAAAAAAKLAGFEAVLTEGHVAQPVAVREALAREIAACDTYLGLFDRRRGSVPATGTADHRAITEEELRLAREQGLRCLVFLSRADAGSREPALAEFLAREVTDYAGGLWTRPYDGESGLRREIVAGLAGLRPRVVLGIDAPAGVRARSPSARAMPRRGPGICAWRNTWWLRGDLYLTTELPPGIETPPGTGRARWRSIRDGWSRCGTAMPSAPAPRSRAKALPSFLPAPAKVSVRRRRTCGLACTMASLVSAAFKRDATRLRGRSISQPRRRGRMLCLQGPPPRGRDPRLRGSRRRPLASGRTGQPGNRSAEKVPARRCRGGPSTFADRPGGCRRAGDSRGSDDPHAAGDTNRAQRTTKALELAMVLRPIGLEVGLSPGISLTRDSRTPPPPGSCNRGAPCLVSRARR
jgi:hypothetical protein